MAKNNTGKEDPRYYRDALEDIFEEDGLKMSLAEARKEFTPKRIARWVMESRLRPGEKLTNSRRKPDGLEPAM